MQAEDNKEIKLVPHGGGIFLALLMAIAIFSTVYIIYTVWNQPGPVVKCVPDMFGHGCEEDL